MKNVAIILGAGKSTRCGFDKLFTGKFGKPVIYQTLEKFEACEDVDEIVLVLSDERTRLPENEDLKKCFSKISQIVAGCEERFFSLQNAIEVLEKKENCR
ncbi:MAG: 2-C-methyl-D-erythritol 4-phosphate cytidylyltransferase, partial [Candidatus Peregrinibacteria bacterium]|nr:2-C-methyl-D-erythritol 4-phosphate cytidylyltransferase [Candidatus Peregrinibacteria bacterium]